jgi:RHS repeat-associated protein
VQAGGTTPSSRAYQDPWGELSWSGTPPLLGFQSELTDSATGAVATPARWYLPTLARFMAPDSLKGNPALPTSLNRLAYAADDPLTLWDPTGLRPLCGEGCTPQEEAELVRAWAQAQTQAAASGTGTYADRGASQGPGVNLARPGVAVKVDALAFHLGDNGRSGLFSGDDDKKVCSGVSLTFLAGTGFCKSRAGTRLNVGVGLGFGVTGTVYGYPEAHHVTAQGPTLCLIVCFGYSKTDYYDWGSGEYIATERGWGFQGVGLGVGLFSISGDVG